MRTLLVSSTFAAFAIGQFAVSPAFASPETSARAARRDRAYREVSITTFEPLVQGIWEEHLVRGAGITLDENATLLVKSERCHHQTLAGLRGEGDNPVVTQFPCEGAKWKPSESKFVLANITLETIAATEKNGPQKRGPHSAKWFQLEFVYIGESGFAVLNPSIECPSQRACEAMAEELRALVKPVKTMAAAIASIANRYRGIVVEKSSAASTLIVRTDLFDANLARMRTRQQACVRKSDQECDRDKLWRERIAVADITKLSPAVEIGEAREESLVHRKDGGTETITIVSGFLTVKCAQSGCWKQRVGGDGGKITEGLQREEILCGASCAQMKKDFELLITLATAPEKGTR